jgi:hypothetical protein
MADAKIVQALQSFSADIDGVPVGVNAGDKFYDDDPAVTGRRHLFGEITVRSTRARRPIGPDTVETATAGPGERRTMSGPGPGRPRGAAKGG